MMNNTDERWQTTSRMDHYKNGPGQWPTTDNNGPPPEWTNTKNNLGIINKGWLYWMTAPKDASVLSFIFGLLRSAFKSALIFCRCRWITYCNTNWWWPTMQQWTTAMMDHNHNGPQWLMTMTNDGNEWQWTTTMNNQQWTSTTMRLFTHSSISLYM